MLQNKDVNPDSSQAIIILQHEGGAGDIVAQIPVVRAFRKKFPSDFLIVLSTYAQLWENNPYPDKVISLSNPGNFYEKYVVGKNVRFYRKRFLYNFCLEHEFEPFLGASNLREFACRCYGIEHDFKPPEIFLSEDEKRQAKFFMSQTDKKKVLIHAFSAIPSEHLEKMICGGCGGKGIGPDGNRCQMCGGRGSISLMQKTNSLKDVTEETAQHILKLAQKYSQQGYEFLQVGLEGEPVIGGASDSSIIDCLGLPMRDVLALIPECASYIFIESLFQHAAGAFQKPGVVILQNTREFFAYPEVAHFVKSKEKCPLGFNDGCGRPVGALLDLLGIYRNPKNPKEILLWECPNQTCNKITYEDLEKAFVASLEGPPRPSNDQGHNTLEAARQAKGPVKLSKQAKVPDLKSSPKLTVVKSDETPDKSDGNLTLLVTKEGVAQGVQQDQIRQPKKVVPANTTEKGCQGSDNKIVVSEKSMEQLVEAIENPSKPSKKVQKLLAKYATKFPQPKKKKPGRKAKKNVIKLTPPKNEKNK